MAGKACCGGGSGSAAACVQADSTGVLDVDGAGCIGFTASPTGPITVTPTGLDVCISPNAGNALSKDVNGCLYALSGGTGSPPSIVTAGPGATVTGDGTPGNPYVVSCDCGTDTVITAGDNITVTGTGTPGDPYVITGTGGGGALCYSTDPNNAAHAGTDNCILVEAGDGLAIDGSGALVVNPSPTGPVRNTPTGLDICISPDAENALAKDANGCLKVTAGDGLVIGPGGELDVDPGPGLGVEPDGSLGVCLSADAGNTAEIGTDGCLYVPAGGGAPGTIVPETVTFPDDGSFDPTAYPGLQYVRVRVQGDGGGGAGTIAASNGGGGVPPFASIGAGGLGGGYAESILTAAELGAGPIPITVGPGGTGGPAGGGPAGAGSGSSFGSLVTAEGGPGALGSENSNVYGAIGPALATPAGGVGDLVIPGGMSTPAFFAIGDESGSPGVPTVVGVGSLGGSAHLSNGSGAAPWGSRGVNDGTFNTLAPPAGLNYGGGGAGALSLPNAAPDVARAGGAGAPGVVIVEVFRMI